MSKLKGNRIEVLSQKRWELADRQMLWNLFIEGRGYNTISKLVNHTFHECENEIWKIATQYRKEGDRKLITGPDRKNKPWSARDLKIIRLAIEAGVTKTRIAELLGRDQTDVEQRVNTRRGMRSFF